MSSELEIIDINAVIEVTQPSLSILEITESPDNILEVTESSNTENLVFIQSPLIEITEVAERGLPGDSAYEIAVLNGFVGTELQWLASLKGEQGENTLGSHLSETLIITDILEQTFILSQIPTANSLVGYLNGLRERNSAFQITGNIITFSTLDLAAGDELTFDYTFGI